MDEKGTAFVSYAWGGELERKEWLRDDIVQVLSYDFSVFWDRDSIPFGETPDEAISSNLAKRPVVVLCMCDQAYIASASKADSGLRSELAMLAQIAGSKDVRIIPIILDRECIPNLPTPLAGRTYLDLSALYERKLQLGDAVLAVAAGGTQAQVAALLSLRLRQADMRDRARAYFHDSPKEFLGSGRTHVVRDNQGQLLLPPKWMWESSIWKRRLSEENDHFCPSKGIWDWRNGTASTGMWALGTAACAAFFPDKTGIDDILAIERAGLLLAQHCISFVEEGEPLPIASDDLFKSLINEEIDVLDRLLPSLAKVDT
ncbi:toll/interleukin-1 receptor domain-containing protein [Ralstonia flaminis]|jgi:hypothetical protein|uniref:TIR domain-containing protein n=1 Tax=Ralstonia flaminis TaxID=3058597 RepID=A0ABM9K9A2_9RALS|nr:toll/interleukin-1 receptor domain-containing protein [Ralstonia sp. LMG 18101]CAJ0820313.1 hypothetical protein LMG18101_04241 [Ralstonia sp. LMG 18101]